VRNGQGSKDITVALSESELEIEVYWTYYYDSGRYFGKPEDCYPEEEECEVIPPKDLADIVKAHADRMIPIWIKEIESQCAALADDRAPAEWGDDEY
jgi:hypothetical protein